MLNHSEPLHYPNPAVVKAREITQIKISLISMKGRLETIVPLSSILYISSDRRIIYTAEVASGHMHVAPAKLDRIIAHWWDAGYLAPNKEAHLWWY